ncbi:phage holin family protein [Chitinispirillales bacterium ANBcel5]|uniref:phage holin family protein n=1 Tax=Cellulosispirillum alkaliphilum TaxID=3039283 RepID=UPI002A4EBD74|nr:phage holin family protein [Chitinispirillales bacterium ANBcel5]
MNNKDYQNENDKNTFESMSVAQIFKRIKNQVFMLAKKEVTLAKEEAKEDLRRELFTLKGILIAAVLFLLTVCMLLVTLTFILGNYVSLWVAGLIITGVLLLASLIVAAVAWKKRVTSALPKTKKTIKKDIKIAKGRFA